jgi:hypothetical protein
MRPAPLLIALLAGVALPASAVAEPVRGPYFVEFRARDGGVMGHTYVMYGRLDQSGRVRDAQYAGLYPDGAWEQRLMTLGPLVVAPAYVGVDRKDRAMPPTASYRVGLNADEYARLQGTVHRLRQDRPRWHLLFHNCNDFVAQVAQSVGLWTPPGWAKPTRYVNNLRAINRP